MSQRRYPVTMTTPPQALVLATTRKVLRFDLAAAALIDQLADHSVPASLEQALWREAPTGASPSGRIEPPTERPPASRARPIVRRRESGAAPVSTIVERSQDDASDEEEEEDCEATSVTFSTFELRKELSAEPRPVTEEHPVLESRRVPSLAPLESPPSNHGWEIIEPRTEPSRSLAVTSALRAALSILLSPLAALARRYARRTSKP